MPPIVKRFPESTRSMGDSRALSPNIGGASQDYLDDAAGGDMAWPSRPRLFR